LKWTYAKHDTYAQQVLQPVGVSVPPIIIKIRLVIDDCKDVNSAKQCCSLYSKNVIFVTISSVLTQMGSLE
jgi:hypothetical protein